MRNKRGQATLEYIIVLIFVGIIGIQLIRGLSSFLGDSIGSFSDILSSHLTVGVCKRDCFYNGYLNGVDPGN
jgi:hypothetical protein